MKRIQSLFIILSGLFFIVSCKTDKKEELQFADLGRPQNTLVIRLEQEADNLNPLISTTNYGRQVYEQIFSYLLIVDPQTYELIPQLAKSRPTIEAITSGPNAGGTAYNFEIFEEAKWDNGEPVTGHDFVFTMKAIFNPKVRSQRMRAFLDFIQDIQVDPENSKKFKVITNQRYILSEEAIAGVTPVMPAYHYDPNGLLADIPFTDFTDDEKIADLAENDPRIQEFADNFSGAKYGREPGQVLGSGPYKLTEWQSGQQIVIERKTDWWGDALSEDYPGLVAYPDAMIFKPMENMATALAELKSGALDVMNNIGPKDFGELKETDFVTEQYNLFTPISLVYYFTYLNGQREKLSDKRVRRAIAHGINVDQILENVYYGYGERLAGPVLPSSEYYNDELALLEHDPSAARALLEEAGWEDSNNNGIYDKEINGELQEMNLSYLTTAGSEISRNIGLVIQQNLRQIGVELELDAQEGNVKMGNLRSGNYDICGGGWALSPTLWDPKQIWHTESQGSSNRVGFGTAETDAMIEEIRTTLDRERRNELYKEFQEIIYEEQPYVFFFAPTARLAIHKRFEAETTSIFPGFVLNRLKLKGEEALSKN